MVKTYLPTQSATRTFDAAGKTLGRLATEIAVALRGKDKATFAPHTIVGDLVVVTNARQIHVTGDKLNQKTYYRHTGYLGNLKSMTLGQLMATDPTEPLRRAVYGMLPDNRLRKELMKRLTIHAGAGSEEITDDPSNSLSGSS